MREWKDLAERDKDSSVREGLTKEERDRYLSLTHELQQIEDIGDYGHQSVLMNEQSLAEAYIVLMNQGRGEFERRYNPFK